jgi:nitrite reductase/ring-hydroxylating ferredoxin subunit
MLADVDAWNMAVDDHSSDAEYVAVADLDEVRQEGPLVVGEQGRTIALFHHEGEVFAVDNRCPHMGFPLKEGTVEEGVLTCHWHHARFELSGGDTFDPWADDIQTFPVAVTDGEVRIDPDPEPNVPPATRWRNRLADGLQENIRLVMAKSVIGLLDAGEDYITPLETAVEFGTTYRDMGWSAGLTILTSMANCLDAFAPEERKRALYLGTAHVANDCAGEPPRFQQHGFETRDVSTTRLKEWYRENIEVRDADAAERVLRTAIGSLSPPEVAEVMFAAATDHLYMDTGHALDHLNKAFEVLDHLGWEYADQVLPACIDNFTDATRSEELSSWRQPIDLAALCFDFHDDLPDLVAAGQAGSDDRRWEHPDDFVDTLLSDVPHEIDAALREAVEKGATSEQLASAVTTAAMRRVVQFSTGNEFSDWNTVHHTFTYANAVHGATRRTDAVELYRGVYDAAMSVYLDRFLNTPPAPVPEPGDPDADPATIRERLLETFDEQGQENRATRLVAHHFDAGGDPTALRETLGEGLLREDATFHTLQSVEAGFTQFERTESDRERRLALMAPARYMAAHFPTRRENDQTFSIAARLHRGENIHEAD